MIAPTLLAAVIARRASGELSIYSSQLPRRLEPGIIEASMLLTAIRSRGRGVSILVGHLVDTRYPVVDSSTPLSHAVDSMIAERRRLVVVVDISKKPLGAIDAKDLEELIEKVGKKPDMPVGSVPLRKPPTLPASVSVEEALDVMVRSGYDYALVTDNNGSYRGVVTIEEIDAALAHIYLEES